VPYKPRILAFPFHRQPKHRLVLPVLSCPDAGYVSGQQFLAAGENAFPMPALRVGREYSQSAGPRVAWYATELQKIKTYWRAR
jgi:hypothetical protein